MGAVNRPSNKRIWLFRSLCNDSLLPIFLALGIVFNLIQTSAALPPVATQRDVTAAYSGSLSSSSPFFFRPNGPQDYYYYKAIQVTVPTNGTYTFRSISNIDTYGLFYSNYVDPSNPAQNLITSDDDGAGGGQFLVTMNLTSGSIYVLLVTTYSGRVTGNFSIQASGPSSVNLAEFTPSTSRPLTTRATIPPTSAPFTTRTTTRSPVSSTYSGLLSSSSPIFARPGTTSPGYYYFQAIQVTVSATGSYNFTSSSDMDTYGLFYSGSFDPSNPSQNLMASDDDTGGNNRQFLITTRLQNGERYVLVVSTFAASEMGLFSVRASGPSSVGLTAFNPSTSRPIITTPSTPILSSFSGYLSSISPAFNRPGDSTGNYYYQAIRVSVAVSGLYSFTSVSSMDTYGLFYNNYVDPSYPSQNLIASDDDSGGNQQFRLNVSLSYATTYALIVTTYSSNGVGTFSVRVSGPSSVELTAFNPSSSRPIRTTPSSGSHWNYGKDNTLAVPAIVGIIVACLVVVTLIIVAVHVHQKKRATSVRRVDHPSARNPTALGSSYPLGNMNRNGPSAHGNQTPYIIGAPRVHNMYMEQPPPSYESIRPMPKGPQQHNTEMY